jgi:hypothetical protein
MTGASCRKRINQTNKSATEDMLHHRREAAVLRLIGADLH